MTTRLSSVLASLLFLLLGSAGSTVHAHALSPMLLNISEGERAGAYALEWHRAPADAWAAQVRPALPSGCELRQGWRDRVADGTRVVSNADALCSVERADIRIAIPGLEQHPGSVIVRLARSDGAVTTLLLGDGESTFSLQALDAASAGQRFGSYFSLGVVHLFGPDHLLFVIGLFLLVQGLRNLLWVTAAFTVGHSLTLGLATLGVLHIPEEVAEFGIALSIVLLGHQVLLRLRGAGSGIWGERPVRFAALFGLLHGLGFAGALADIGLPVGDVPMALLAFNLGVEVGQLAVILPLWWLRHWLSRARAGMQPRLGAGSTPTVHLALPYVIGTFGAFWCIDRALLLLPAL